MPELPRESANPLGFPVQITCDGLIDDTRGPCRERSPVSGMLLRRRLGKRGFGGFFWRGD